MAVNFRTTIGTVNFTDWLHITASKVSSPSTVAWETWINVPITNYNLIIPNLDPENYYIRAYDAPTNVALGTLQIELIVNGLTSEFLYERRFYRCGGGNPGDPANGSDRITDPYLIGKSITGTEQESFRHLIPTEETTFDDAIGEIVILTGHVFSPDEVFAVEIKYSAGTVPPSGSVGIYSGTITVVDPTYSLLPADRGKRVRLKGTGITQEIAMPLLSQLSTDDGYYFDNSIGGVARCVKLLMQGGDRIFFNGFMAASDEFAEFWVAKGEHVLIRKFNDTYFEVLTDYAGVNCGEVFRGHHKDHPNTIIMDGQIGIDALDGDEYPRLWWLINNVIPSTHVITDDLVVGTGYIHPAGKEGLIVKHSTLKKFRTGNWQSLAEKGLKNFKTYGGDAGRVYDYPGGKQNEKMMKHRHMAVINYSATSNGFPANTSMALQHETGGIGDFKYTLAGRNSEPDWGRTGLPRNDAGTLIGDDKNIIDNGGVVYLCRI